MTKLTETQCNCTRKGVNTWLTIKQQLTYIKSLKPQCISTRSNAKASVSRMQHGIRDKQNLKFPYTEL